MGYSSRLYQTVHLDGAHFREGDPTRMILLARYAKKTMDDNHQVGIVIDKKHPKFQQCGNTVPGCQNFALMGLFALQDIYIEWQRGEGRLKPTLMGNFVRTTDQDIWWEQRSSTVVSSGRATRSG